MIYRKLGNNSFDVCHLCIVLQLHLAVDLDRCCYGLFLHTAPLIRPLKLVIPAVHVGLYIRDTIGVKMIHFSPQVFRGLVVQRRNL